MVLLILFVLSRVWNLAPEQGRELPPEGATVRVERVIDGDTIVIAGGKRVRLLGVDTPETKHPQLPPQPFGAEATQFTRELAGGRAVRLEFDRERYDRYQRILAYVYVDDVLLNEALIRAGLGTAEPQYPYRSDMKRRFLKAEEQAQEEGRGIWSLSPPVPQ